MVCARALPLLGAVFVGLAPQGIKREFTVPRKCLGYGRGQKALLEWEERQLRRRGSVGRSSPVGRTAEI